MLNVNTPAEFLDTVRGLSTDILIVIGVATVLFLFFFRNGIRSATALILATYAAVVGYLIFPYFDTVAPFAGRSADAPILHLGVFLVLLILCYLVIRKPVAADVIWYGARRWFLSVFFVALETGLLIALSYHVLPVRAVLPFNAIFDPFFGSATALFAWYAVPLLAMFLLMRRTL